MPNYNLFISHSWTYSDAYEKLIKLLKSKPNFTFSDYSIPKDDPIHNAGNDKKLYEAIKNKIAHTNVILIMAGVYSTYSKWIQKEIQIAKNDFLYQKPILAIEPFGADKTSSIVKVNADEIVKWNADSIVEAIRRLC